MTALSTWVEVQRHTFKNWVNNALSNRGLRVDALETDLQDGLMLINLFEILVGTPITTREKRPTHKSQKISNLHTALQFIKDDGCRLVNIGPEDIYEGNLKLILGLIWSLILRYQIVGIEEGSPKHLLLEWVQEKLAPYPIPKVTDFKKSWKHGQAIAALVDSMDPGIHDLDSNLTGDDIADITNAMNKAENYLNPGIPQLMRPGDMAAALDDLSVMAYVSCFKDWDESKTEFEKERLRAVATFMDGPGLEHGYTKIPNVFTVHSCDENGNAVSEGGEMFDISVVGPQRADVDVLDNGDGTYTVTYQTMAPGAYQVEVKLAGHDVTGSPTTVNVKPDIDALSSYADGPGVVTAKDNEPTFFTIHTIDSKGTPLVEGGQDICISITGLSDSPVDVSIGDNDDGTYTVHYAPDAPGECTIHVDVDGKEIKDSPFTITVAPGIQGQLISGIFTYTIHARDKHGNRVTTGGADWQVSIKGPNDSIIEVKTADHNDGKYSASYELYTIEGADAVFEVNCMLDGQLVGNSPFKHRLGPKPSLFKAATNKIKSLLGNKNKARTVQSSPSAPTLSPNQHSQSSESSRSPQPSEPSNPSEHSNSSEPSNPSESSQSLHSQCSQPSHPPQPSQPSPICNHTETRPQEHKEQKSRPAAKSRTKLVPKKPRNPAPKKKLPPAPRKKLPKLPSRVDSKIPKEIGGGGFCGECGAPFRDPKEDIFCHECGTKRSGM